MSHSVFHRSSIYSMYQTGDVSVSLFTVTTHQISCSVATGPTASSAVATCAGGAAAARSSDARMSMLYTLLNQTVLCISLCVISIDGHRALLSRRPVRVDRLFCK